MTTVKLSVKWGKETFNDVEVDLTAPPLMFKSQLFALTNVPPDRQKVMIKGALLKDDEWGKAAPKDGMTVMLMGSADAVKVEAPKDLPKFVEDLPQSEQDHMDTKHFGAGLVNLGNTCYMNATLQCMYAVQPLRTALNTRTPATTGGDTTTALVRATRELFADLERGGAPFPPLGFLLALRAKFPQFAQQGQGGMYMQQDAEECWTNVMYSLREKLKDDDGGPCVDKLFGVKTHLKLTCEESGEDLQEDGLSYTLKVNIDEKTGNVNDGVALGLKEERERTSAALGRSVLFRGGTEVTGLPPFLTLQMMRFFFRRDNQQKAKILKKVTFPLEFDAYDFCAPALKAELDAPRAAYKEALDKAIEEKKLLGRKKGAAEGAAVAAAPAAAAAGGDADMADAGASTSAAAGTKDAMTGKYELVGVVTHKGRTADSGHYVAWVKQPDATWVCFDDENLTIRTEEEVLQLSGGGDWHMAYLLVYRAVHAKVPDAAAEAAAVAADGGEATAKGEEGGGAAPMEAEAGGAAAP